MMTRIKVLIEKKQNNEESSQNDEDEWSEDSDSKVASFIDKIITCEEPVDNAELLELVN